MSIVFSSSCPTFLRSTFGSSEVADDDGRYPMTLAGWAKFTSFNNFKYIASIGLGFSGNSYKLQTRSSNNIRMHFDQGVNDGVEDTLASTIALDTWYWISISRSSLTSGYIKLSTHSGTLTETEDTDDCTGGAWSNGDELRYIAFASQNLTLASTITDDYKGIKLASWAAWSRELTSAESAELKDGAHPESISAGIIGHWMDKSGSYATSVTDKIGSADLVPYTSTTGVEETTSANWPTYDDTDHPTIDAVDPDPVLSSPNANESVTTATPTVTTDTASGTAFGLIQAAADAAPTDPDDLINDGSSFQVAVSSTSITFAQQTGLTASTDYKCYFTQEITGGLQADIVFDTFTTASDTNGVKITLVEEIAGVKTPYASGTAIQYRLYEGTSMTGFTLEYSGTTETTDASGVMEITTASHTISDRLFAVVARPSASGIMSDDVIAAIGPVTVVAL